MLLVGKKGENGLTIGLTLRRAWVPMSDQVLWGRTEIRSGVGQVIRKIEELGTEYRDNIFGRVLL